MSLEAMAWAWKQDVKGTRKLVLLALADYADAEGECWPAAERLIERCSVERTQIFGHLKKLEELKLIERSPRFRSDGSQRSNLYLLQLDRTAPCGEPDAGVREPGPHEPSGEPPQEELEATSSKVPDPAPPDPVLDVLTHYDKVMEPRSPSVEDPQARKLVREALKVATAAECKRAIGGCRASGFHMGDNQRRKKYNRVSQILKGRPGRETTRERIDFFLDLAEKAGVQSHVTSADPARISQAKRDVLDAWEFPNDEHVVRRGRESEEWLVAQGVVVQRGDDGRPTFTWKAES